MSRPEILLKSHSPHRGGHEHFSTGINVFPVSISSRQRVDDEMNSFEGDPIAEWLEDRRAEGLNAMCQCIQTRGRSKCGWQIHRNLRVKDHQFGKQAGEEDD